MKIGLLLPSLLTAKRFEQRIFAPKDLFVGLADALVTKGHEVYAYTSTDVKTKAQVISTNSLLEQKELPSEKDMKRTEQEIAVLTSFENSYEYELEMVSHAFAHAKNEKLDLMHAFHSPLSHYFTSTADFPVLFTLHDPVFQPHTLEFNRLKKFSDHTFNVLSNSQKKNYLELLPLQILATVYNGVDVDEFPYSETVEPIACFIGRYFPEKGIDDALQAAITAEIPLKIASSNNYKESTFYKENVMPYLTNPMIEELPFLLPPQRNAVLKKTKMLLFPSKWEEPFGMAMIESMAVGTPVVAYSRGSAPEVIVDGETGFLVNQDAEQREGDYIIKETGIAGLVAAMKRLADLPEQDYVAMRRKCRKRVELQFSARRMADSYEKLYQQMVNK